MWKLSKSCECEDTIGFYVVPYKMNFIKVQEFNDDNGWEICNECYYEKVFSFINNKKWHF